MFDLENTIARWRSESNAHESIDDATAAELESHLREQIDDLIAHGLSAEEAFIIATKRLGRSAELAPEFAVSAPGAVWRRRIFWGVLGYLQISVILALIRVLGKSATLAAAASGVSANLPGVALAAHIVFFLIITATVAGIWLHASNKGLPSIGHLCTRHPGRIAMLTVCLLVLLWGLGGIMHAAAVRFVAPPTFGATSLWLAFYGAASKAIILAALTAAAIFAGRVFRDPATPRPDDAGR